MAKQIAASGPQAESLWSEIAAATATERSSGPSRADVSEDIRTGQIVIVAARWVLIATGLALALWAPREQDLAAVEITIGVLLCLAAANFYLNAQIVLGKFLPRSLLYAASAVDIGIITLITWAYGGIGSSLFVYYYPALLAFALVFPMSISLSFAGGLVAAYALVSFPSHPSDLDFQVLTVRLISLLAVAVLANLYQQVERRRRSQAADAEGTLLAEVDRRLGGA